MKRKGAGNKAHLQPVPHFLVHIGISIARVVFQCAGTKFRYVTLIMLQDRAHGVCVAVCRCGNDRERQQIFRFPIMPCPVVSLGITIYAGYKKKNKLLLALLAIWGLTGIKSVIFSAYEDIILLVCGIYAVTLFVHEIKHFTKK